MNFQEFTEQIKNGLRDFLPEEFAESRIDLISVEKNNGLTLTGINVNRSGQNISPTIYLENLYDEYKDGKKDMQTILTEIADVRVKRDVDINFNEDTVREYDRIKNSIMPKLVNIEWNKEILKDIPYTKVSDLAVTYLIMIDQSLPAIATTAVTNKIMEIWGIDTETLHEQAIQNLQAFYPSTFNSINYKIDRTLNNRPICANEGFDNDDDEEMYVLSNKVGMYGACNLLDKVIMGRIVDKLGKDFYILPSSIHECIIVKSFPDLCSSEIDQMICEINTVRVKPDERLSNHHYRYTVEDGLII